MPTQPHYPPTGTSNGQTARIIPPTPRAAPRIVPVAATSPVQGFNRIRLDGPEAPRPIAAPAIARDYRNDEVMDYQDDDMEVESPHSRLISYLPNEMLRGIFRRNVRFLEAQDRAKRILLPDLRTELDKVGEAFTNTLTYLESISPEVSIQSGSNFQTNNAYIFFDPYSVGQNGLRHLIRQLVPQRFEIVTISDEHTHGDWNGTGLYDHLAIVLRTPNHDSTRKFKIFFRNSNYLAWISRMNNTNSPNNAKIFFSSTVSSVTQYAFHLSVNHDLSMVNPQLFPYVPALPGDRETTLRAICNPVRAVPPASTRGIQTRARASATPGPFVAPAYNGNVEAVPVHRASYTYGTSAGFPAGRIDGVSSSSFTTMSSRVESEDYTIDELTATIDREILEDLIREHEGEEDEEAFDLDADEVVEGDSYPEDVADDDGEDVSPTPRTRVDYSTIPPTVTRAESAVRTVPTQGTLAERLRTRSAEYRIAQQVVQDARDPGQAIWDAIPMEIEWERPPVPPIGPALSGEMFNAPVPPMEMEETLEHISNSLSSALGVPREMLGIDTPSVESNEYTTRASTTNLRELAAIPWEQRHGVETNFISSLLTGEGHGLSDQDYLDNLNLCRIHTHSLFGSNKSYVIAQRAAEVIRRTPNLSYSLSMQRFIAAYTAPAADLDEDVQITDNRYLIEICELPHSARTSRQKQVLLDYLTGNPLQRLNSELLKDLIYLKLNTVAYRVSDPEVQAIIGRNAGAMYISRIFTRRIRELTQIVRSAESRAARTPSANEEPQRPSSRSVVDIAGLRVGRRTSEEMEFVDSHITGDGHELNDRTYLNNLRLLKVHAESALSHHYVHSTNRAEIRDIVRRITARLNTRIDETVARINRGDLVRAELQALAPTEIADVPPQTESNNIELARSPQLENNEITQIQVGATTFTLPSNIPEGTQITISRDSMESLGDRTISFERPINRESRYIPGNASGSMEITRIDVAPTDVSFSRPNFIPEMTGYVYDPYIPLVVDNINREGFRAAIERETAQASSQTVVGVDVATPEQPDQTVTTAVRSDDRRTVTIEAAAEHLVRLNREIAQQYSQPMSQPMFQPSHARTGARTGNILTDIALTDIEHEEAEAARQAATTETQAPTAEVTATLDIPSFTDFLQENFPNDPTPVMQTVEAVQTTTSFNQEAARETNRMYRQSGQSDQASYSLFRSIVRGTARNRVQKIRTFLATKPTGLTNVAYIEELAWARTNLNLILSPNTPMTRVVRLREYIDQRIASEYQRLEEIRALQPLAPLPPPPAPPQPTLPTNFELLTIRELVRLGDRVGANRFYTSEHNMQRKERIMRYVMQRPEIVPRLQYLEELQYIKENIEYAFGSLRTRTITQRNRGQKLGVIENRIRQTRAEIELNRSSLPNVDDALRAYDIAAEEIVQRRAVVAATRQSVATAQQRGPTHMVNANGERMTINEVQEFTNAIRALDETPVAATQRSPWRFQSVSQNFFGATAAAATTIDPIYLMDAPYETLSTETGRRLNTQLRNVASETIVREESEHENQTRRLDTISDSIAALQTLVDEGTRSTQETRELAARLEEQVRQLVSSNPYNEPQEQPQAYIDTEARLQPETLEALGLSSFTYERMEQAMQELSGTSAVLTPWSEPIVIDSLAAPANAAPASQTETIDGRLEQILELTRRGIPVNATYTWDSLATPPLAVETTLPARTSTNSHLREANANFERMLDRQRRNRNRR